MDIFSDPKTAALAKAFLAKSLEPPAPKQHTADRPYYNEANAKEAKRIIDAVLATRQPIKLVAEGVSVVTIRLQYYEGARYLKNVLDKKYVELAANTVCRTYDGYIEIHPKKRATKLLSDYAHIGVNVNWKEDFIAFIENAKPLDKFMKDNLLITETDIEWVHNQMADIKDLFVYRVTKTDIRVIRDEKI